MFFKSVSTKLKDSHLASGKPVHSLIRVGAAQVCPVGRSYLRGALGGQPIADGAQTDAFVRPHGSAPPS